MRSSRSGTLTHAVRTREGGSPRRHERARIVSAIVSLLFSSLLLAALPVRANHEATNPTWWGSNYLHPCDRTAASQCVANNTLHLYKFSTSSGTSLSSSRKNATIRGFDLYNDNSEVSAA